MQKFTPLWCRFIKKLTTVQNTKKSNWEGFQSASYHRICRILIDILKPILVFFFLNLSEK